ncbi:hypothetical protein F4804DRAFT_326346 [Jackrogersella minutella]|nr:hypothetical protein F4804DRAFT_326346 [Jackrogersella minutella]
MEVYARLSTAGSNTDGTTKFESDIVPLSSRGLHLIIEGIFLALFTGVWTGMRLWCRRMKKVPISIEDWLHLTALFFFYGQVVTCFISVSMGGAGHHVNELQPWHIVRFYKAIFAIQVLYALGVGFVKISITVMLMRIFVTRRVRIAGSFIIFISALWIVLTILVGLLLCKPIQQNWNMNAGGTCGNQYAGFGVVAAVDIFNEICLLILPIPSVLNLHIHNRYKVALAGVFGTGIMSVT